jgi:hypothetical protein
MWIRFQNDPLPSVNSGHSRFRKHALDIRPAIIQPPNRPMVIVAQRPAEFRSLEGCRQLDVISLFDESEFKIDDKTRILESELAHVSDQITKTKARLSFLLTNVDLDPDEAAAKALVQSRKALQARKDALATELEHVRGEGSPLDHIQAVQALIVEATGDDHPGRYEARARISQALRNIIDEIVFDDEARSIIVIAGNHTAGFRIDIEEVYSIKYLRRDTVMQLRTQARGSKMEALIRRVG